MLELEPSRIEVGTPVGALDTPCLVVDLDRMERNLRDWQADIDRYGTKLRPHIKTHKVPEIALQQEKLGAVGIACAKGTEAEPFVAAGCRDGVLSQPAGGRDEWERLGRPAPGTKVGRKGARADAAEGRRQRGKEGRPKVA